MGLTIHYSAQLKNMDLLPQFVEEVEDICQALGWKSERVSEVFKMKDKGLKFVPPLLDPINISLEGIVFYPPKCEPVLFDFLSSGWTSSNIHLRLAKEYQKLDKYKEFRDLPKLVYMMHSKTQYAGPDTHIALIKLFKYLEKKYFTSMHVGDEGNYWETMDESVLLSRFEEYTSLINSVKGALEKEDWAITHQPFTLTSKMDDLLEGRNTN
jgi:hypothetical protein